MVASCTMAPQRQRIINIVRAPAGDHFPAYNCMPATSASMAKLRAIASVHSTTCSLRRKKRTTIIPGQTKRNQNTMIGRIAVSVNTKYTRPAAIAERMIIVGHSRFERMGVNSVVFGIDGAEAVGEDSTGLTCIGAMSDTVASVEAISCRDEVGCVGTSSASCSDGLLPCDRPEWLLFFS